MTRPKMMGTLNALATPVNVIGDIFYETDEYKKAAALVNLANDESGMPLEILDIPNIQTVAKFYINYIRFYIIWTLNYFALITLNFFEKPLWCSNPSKVSCSNRHYYYLGGLPYLTSPGSLAFESVTFVILVVHILFPILYEGWSVYWKNHVNKLKVILLLILAADLVVYTLYLSPVAIDTLPFRIAPYLRVVFFILYIRYTLDAGFVPSVSPVLELLFVLFTTSNNPDVWIPAYNSSRWSSLFFVLFVLLGVYFLTNLVLAVVYESFECGLAKQVSEKDQKKEKILRRAFDVIDDYHVGYLNRGQCMSLLINLKDYRTLPNISDEEFELIFDTLDGSHDFKAVVKIRKLEIG
ncbi:ion transport domain-containing protein [Artemisia annua]|uniref:Ion transport domain-containing protein n=1 Tax=Artemisia annua TaxID=35608 RepID=A0A2U1PNP3_ARTAN|nr:ion transport domain-containing protein [Artemisia annua]